jgi:copper chaperone CopZ
MVCSFCSTGIEKTFSKQPSVEKVKVNMDEKVVFLTLKESGQLSDEKIKELITDSGFNVAGIERKKAQPKAAK